MLINSDINILGGLPDWNLLSVFLRESLESMRESGGVHTFTAIKTDKSVKRFENAISATLIKFQNPEIEALVRDSLMSEGLSQDSLLLLFWNASFNNELLHYLNKHTFFVSFYSGRISIKQDEVFACLKELSETERELKKWSDSTLNVTASKYLTLLKKFGLMEGSHNKTILHPYLNDKMFVLFVYWITSVEPKPNLLESEWLKYSFCERPVFIERIMQKRFSTYFELNYTGDKLKIETLTPYSTLYDVLR